MVVPDAPFEEACMLGIRYRQFNDSGNNEAYHKTYNEFRTLVNDFSDFNDKITLTAAFLASYKGKIDVRN